MNRQQANLGFISAFPELAPPYPTFDEPPAIPAWVPRWRGEPAAIGALIQAIAEARLEFEHVKKDTEGQFEKRRFKYAPMESLRSATEAALSKHGVSVLQIPTGPDHDGRFHLFTYVCGHGGRLEAELSFKVEQTGKTGGDYVDDSKPVKRFGAMTTYLCRYIYKSLFQLDGGTEDDLDAPAYDGPQRQPPTTTKPKGRPAEKPDNGPPTRPVNEKPDPPGIDPITDQTREELTLELRRAKFPSRVAGANHAQRITGKPLNEFTETDALALIAEMKGKADGWAAA